MGIFGRVKRGLTLTKDSLVVLRHHPRLAVFPLVGGSSAIVFLAVLLGTAFGVVTVAGVGLQNGALIVGALFVIYLVTTFVSAFFTAGLVYETRQVFEGAQPDFRRGLAAAWHVKGKLLVWALVSATIGVLLRGLESSGSRGARLFSAVFSVAWTVVTFFVVPVAVLRPETSIRGMFTESAGTFKRTWGETPIGIVGPNLLAVPLYLLGGLFAVGLLNLSPVAAAVGLLVFVALGMLFAATLRGIIKTSLYVYATEGKRPSAFEGEDFEALRVDA